MNTRDELHLATGAYAVDALTGDELQRFERYLAESEDARTEVRGMFETAALLGSVAAPITPSPRLKTTLLGLIAVTPQLPAIGEKTVAEPSQSKASPQPVLLQPVLPQPSAEQPRPELSMSSNSTVRAKVQSLWFARPTSIIAAAAAVAALFFGGNLVVTSMQKVELVRTQAGALATLSSASDVQKRVQPVAGGGNATLIWSSELNRSALVISGLPTLDLGKTYEAWYINASGARAAGIFDATRAGDSWHVLDGTMTATDAVGITVEPGGGSQQPTTKPIVALTRE